LSSILFIDKFVGKALNDFTRMSIVSSKKITNKCVRLIHTQKNLTSSHQSLHYFP